MPLTKAHLEPLLLHVVQAHNSTVYTPPGGGLGKKSDAGPKNGNIFALRGYHPDAEILHRIYGSMLRLHIHT